jgi:SAM-dependent methyltransferase
MTARVVQLWDTGHVAATIDSYWRSSLHEQLHRDALVDLVHHHLPTPSPTILEVGCGSALIHQRLAAAPALMARYVGVDSSTKMLAMARERSLPGQFLAADGYHLPFRGRCFDLAFCFEVLGHLPEVGAFLAELIRVTRQTLLFSIWPSEGPDVLEGHEEIDGVTFIHRAYSDAYIRRTLAEQCPEASASIGLHVLSAECWVYVVQRAADASVPPFRVIPFRSYHQRVTDRLRTALAQIGNHELELSETRKRREQEAASLAERLSAAEGAVVFERAQAAQASDALAATVRCLEEARTELADARHDTATTRAWLEQAREESADARSRLAQALDEKRVAAARADDAQARLAETERRLAVWQHQARDLSTELAAMRRRRLLRLFCRFRPGPDLLPQINPAFQDLLDDSYLFLGRLRGYRLQPSEDLRPPRFVGYSLRLARPNLSGLLLAPIIDLPGETGSLGVELTTPDGVTLAGARVALSELDQHRPARLMFPPVPSSVQRVVLRVDVRDTTTPVRLFEWRKRRFFGLRRLATRPFCGFIFE